MDNAHNLFLVKLFHTAIWAFFVAVICYVPYCGLADDLSGYTWIAIGLVMAEGLVLRLFKGYCPLTLIARNYSDATADNFDIFLPNWLARYNKLIFTSLYLLGLIIVGYRLLHRA